MNSNDLPQSDRQIWSDLPSVSVIIVNYNTREHLEACFHSLQQLIYPQDKLNFILVDNASTDQSVEYVQTTFPHIKIIRNTQNYGFSKANNIGVAHSTAALIAFLNPDMRVDPRWLLELVKPLLDNAKIGAVGSKILSWDAKTIDFAGSAANFYGYGYQVGAGQTVVNNFNQVEPILFACGGAMLIRRQLFLDSGGFDEDYFAYYEDVDLGWRLWVLGHQILFIPTSITYHIHHGAWGKVNDEKRRVLYERNAFFTLLKNYDEANLNKILPAALLLLLKRIHLAAGIDDDLFRIEPADQKQTKRVSTTDIPATLQPTRYGPSYYLKEAERTLRTQGVSALYAKFRTELKQRQSHRGRAQAPGVMQVDKNLPNQATVPLQALSYIVAGNDIIMLYEKMLTKRRLIQTHRGRSDQEIFKLFKMPFGFSELWPEYKETQMHLSHLFEIDKIFANTTADNGH